MEFVRNARTVLCRLAVVMAAALFLVSASAAQQAAPRNNAPPARPNSTPAVAAGAQASQVKYKGIWEPVSYQDDVKLMDVFFATADEGWVVGGRSEIRGGVILHTSDGGAHWDNQYGDPESSDGGVSNLRFLDATHGWAMQSTGGDARLLHTRDGRNWIASGTITPHADDYMFTSETNGVAVQGGRLLRTSDGGQRWTDVSQCEVSVQVEGLARRNNCAWTRLQFLTPLVGYAAGFSVVGGGSGPPARFVVLGKTTDGGATWTLTPGGVTDDTHDAFFVDENTGYVRVGYPDTGQLFKTTDGGKTWTGMAASPGGRILFADPEVGWSLYYNKISFTTDGGNRWNSRQYPFPASAVTFSLPRRDRGYVIGDHGMVYRYSIVPMDYTAKGMIAAPLLSGIDSPLDAEVQSLLAQVNKMSADAGLPPVNSGTADAAATAGGFVQNADRNASATTGGAGGFTQDVGQAQTTLDSVSAEVPKFVARYRNLNLLMAGIQMASQIPAQAQAMQQSFQSLKGINDPQAAKAAITNVQASVAGLMQQVRSAYQKPH